MEGIPQISVQGTGSVNHLELSSIPDALFIIQGEFKKFERDRLAWSIERSELKVSLYLQFIHRARLLNMFPCAVKGLGPGRGKSVLSVPEGQSIEAN